MSEEVAGVQVELPMKQTFGFLFQPPVRFEILAHGKSEHFMTYGWAINRQAAERVMAKAWDDGKVKVKLIDHFPEQELDLDQGHDEPVMV